MSRQESESLETTNKLTRRQLIEQSFRLAISSRLMIELAGAGAFSLIESPITRFFFTPDYRSSTIPRVLTIQTEDMNRIRGVGVGTSYVFGEGGTSPVEIIAEIVKDAELGDWQTTVEAVSGSYLEDIPLQVEKARSTIQQNEVPVVTTDSGYNSLTQRLLENPDTLQDFAVLLDILDHMSPKKVFDLINKFNSVCEAFFSALDETSAQLTDALTEIAESLSQKIYVYEYPPLEYAPSIVHIPQKGNPDDRRPFRFVIAGNSTRELIARRIAALGTNATEYVLESLYQQLPGIQVVPVNLQEALRKKDFRNKKVPDEHPNAEGYERIATGQIEITQVGGTSLYTEVARRI